MSPAASSVDRSLSLWITPRHLLPVGGDEALPWHRLHAGGILGLNAEIFSMLRNAENPVAIAESSSASVDEFQRLLIAGVSSATTSACLEAGKRNGGPEICRWILYVFGPTHELERRNVRPAIVFNDSWWNNFISDLVTNVIRGRNAVLCQVHSARM